MIAPPSTGLVYETTAAVGWRELERALDTDQTARLNDSNELFLRALNTLEESPTQRLEQVDGLAELHPDLERLDTKLNLLLELLGHVLSRQVGLPPLADVRLGASGLQWSGPRQPPAVGCHILVDLYIQARYPRPLELPGQVIAVDEGWVHVDFCGLSEPVEDGLQKLIFRHHRRNVATRRAQNREG